MQLDQGLCSIRLYLDSIELYRHSFGSYFHSIGSSSNYFVASFIPLVYNL